MLSESILAGVSPIQNLIGGKVSQPIATLEERRRREEEGDGGRIKLASIFDEQRPGMERIGRSYPLPQIII
jgi:hypothetical protein